MDEPLRLPIRPKGPNIEAQLFALDQLSVQLSQLTSKTRWPARIPLNSKASVSGEIVHTNDLKVNVGGDWWIEMTAAEARGYIERRNKYLLLAHARVTEGSYPRQNVASGSTLRAIQPSLRFNPIFASPAMPYAPSPDSRMRKSTEISGSIASLPHLPNEPPISAGSAVVEKNTERQTTAFSKEPLHSSSGSSGPVPHPSVSAQIEPSVERASDDLTVLINSFVDKQRTLANGASGSSSHALPSNGDIMTNEEGLPIHEIRENEDGALIGPKPEVTIGETLHAIDDNEQKDDYWSQAAVERRAALRKKLFSAGSDSEDEEDNEREEGSNHNERQPAATDLPAVPADLPDKAALEVISEERPTVDQTEISPKSGESSPTSPKLKPALSQTPSAQPKGILKPPARKKSVSFDASIPSPPPSPDIKPSTTRINGLSFPQPVPSTSSVPLLNLPTPSSAGQRGFAGFKKGFLDVGKGKGKATEEEGKGGKSLFAQRMRSGEKDVAVVANEAGREKTQVGEVKLPRLSESIGTSTVKSSVVEKPMELPNPKVGRTSIPGSDARSDTAGVDILPSIVVAEEAGPLELDDIDSDEEDAYGHIDDDDEEEEYDLDTALLAREAALELHRLRAHNHLLNNPYTSTSYLADPDLEEGEYADPETGVMLALPTVSGFDARGRPMIVNPNPDDIRKSVRVGKLENGNLVLAPGEGEWGSDDEGGEGLGREERERNRERMKRMLLGQEVEEKSGVRQVSKPATGTEREVVDVGLPPALEAEDASTIDSTPTLQPTKETKPMKEIVVPAQPAEPVKKMSRFKAARMGLQ